MATLEEVSVRLMQPEKDLADWNYPFSKDLEKFSIAVVETDDINHSNRGLIIQNIANVYSRRVDYVYQDTTAIAHSFAEHEAAEEATKTPKKVGRGKKIAVDLGDFEPIDFDESVGKNINMKSRAGTNNTIRLLSQRFPQLENVSRSSLPFEVYDVHGDVVGKKHDFRCNQYLTASGMLVEHFTPDDFPNCSTIQKTDISTEDPQMSSTLDATTMHCDSENEQDSELRESFLDDENHDVTSATQEKDCLDASTVSYADSGLGTSVGSADISTRPESSLSCDRELPWDSTQSRAGSSMSMVDENCLARRNSEALESSQEVLSTGEISGNDATERTGEPPQDDNADDNRDAGESPNIVPPLENNGAENQGEIVFKERRRSKRIKNVIDAVNTLNSNPWEPIPFDSVPADIPQGRTEFKLPRPVSPVKSKNRSMKRKVPPTKKKSQSLNSKNQSEPPSKKMTMYAPSSHIFAPFGEEKSEVFQSILRNRPIVKLLRIDKSERGTMASMLELAALKYEAVTNSSMDLLAYRTKSGSDSLPLGENSTKVPSEAGDNVGSDIDDFPSSEPTDDAELVGDEFPMPDTPESSGSSDRLLATPLPSFHSRIERSVREIYDSCDMRTAAEVEVAKWQQQMIPIIREIELRPLFDTSVYRARVIENLQASENHKVEFDDMVLQQMSGLYDVHRYFFSSLQLASTYNLRIDTHDDEGNLTLVELDMGPPSNT